MRAGWMMIGLFALLGGCNSGGGDATPSSEPTFRLSGQIFAPENTAFDSDTNDPDAERVDNSEFGSAQPVANPITIAGYVNEAGEGPNGPLKEDGDLFDGFRVDLIAGQRISLSIAGDGEQDDLDLLLFDDDGNLVSFSDSTSEFESLLVAASGSYDVVVQAFSGASGYILTIGRETSAVNVSARPAEWLGDQIIVKMKSSAKPVASFTSGSAVAGHLGLKHLAGKPHRRMLMRLADGETAYGGFGVNPLAGHSYAPKGSEGARRLRTIQAAKRLSRREDVEYAAPNYRRQASFEPDDPLFDRQWHYQQILLPSAWDLVPNTSDVIVAVIDTGVVLAHTDLNGNLIAGYDFISDASVSGDGNGLDPNPNDPGDGGLLGVSSSWHGTHVAGTVAAETDNGDEVAGVAWNAKIMPLRALGPFGGDDYDIGQAMLFAAGLDNDSGTVPAQPADVINMSFGGAGFSQYLADVAAEVRAAGVVMVAAAGNESSNQAQYPAALNGVLSVSAVDIERELAHYSSFGNSIDVAAPGGDTRRDRNGDGFPDGVLSTHIDETGGDRYISRFLQGTSMASPHVAGVIALMLSVNPALTPQDIDNLLASGALTDDLGAPGRDNRFGHGLINAQKAVTAALQSAGLPVPLFGRLVVNPDSLNFGTTLSGADLELTNVGTAALTINDINADQPWLQITDESVDGDGLGSYQVTVDRQGLAVGTYTGTVAIDTSANDIQVPIIMQVAGAGGATGGNAGHHHIFAVTADTGELVAATDAEIADGVYSYALRVPAGRYRLWAGTDADNDGQICDEGEACGAYKVLDGPLVIEVDGNRNGLDFDTGILSGLGIGGI